MPRNLCRSRSGQLLERCFPFAEPRPLDALPAPRQRTLFLLQLTQPIACFIVPVLSFQECRTGIACLGPIRMLGSRQCVPFPSAPRQSMKADISTLHNRTFSFCSDSSSFYVSQQSRNVRFF